jgi:hypothetical protein
MQGISALINVTIVQLVQIVQLNHAAAPWCGKFYRVA